MKPVDFIEYILRLYILDPSSLLLDVGCGPGLYRHSTVGQYVGIDITALPYSEGTRRDVDCVADGTRLPLRSERFDLIFSKSAFFQIPDYRSALGEFHRVLKPGGRLILFDYNWRTQKVLEKKEGVKRPCWTQWGLRSLLAHSGFTRCELLLPRRLQESGLIRFFHLLEEELRGQWAIVTGVKA